MYNFNNFNYHNHISLCSLNLQTKEEISKLILRTSQNDDSLEGGNRKKRRLMQKIKRRFSKNRILKIAILAGIAISALLILYPPARKLLFSLYYPIKYKLDNESSLSDPNDPTELVQNRPKSKRGQLLLVLLPVFVIIGGLLTQGEEYKYTPVEVQSKGQPEGQPEVRDSRAILEYILINVFQVWVHVGFLK